METFEKIKKTLEIWHDILERNAMEELDPILSDKIVFRSPVAFTAYPGRAAIKLVLKNVNTVFEDFTYHRSFFTDDHLSAVLEFSARVGDKRLKGVDILKFDQEGKIEEFEVMVRPLSGLSALAQQMGEKIAPYKDILTAEQKTEE
jgi:hypothetical protein